MAHTVLYFVKSYLILVFAMLVLQRYVVYYPSRTWVVSPESVGAQVVAYKTVDNIKLTSWYVPPKGGKPVFVLFHGNAGNISNRAFKLAYFAKRGYGFLLAEYRGYGRNAGSPSELGFYNDGRAAMTWLMKDQKIPENKIIVYGESIGTGTACEMAIEYKNIRALVLEAPFTSIQHEADAVYPWLRLFTYLTIDKYDNLSKAGYFDMPVIVLQGSKDEVIPPRQGKELFEAVASPVKKYVPLRGGGHENLADFGLLQHIQAFVEAR